MRILGLSELALQLLHVSQSLDELLCIDIVRPGDTSHQAKAQGE
jgi:hypothetical protein